ncbi:MAG: SurA N-terminal domain-containing protein [Gammaproteobacteria bacterium]|nr:SurA N-terminal domain-containing protein [Gammaproteobacteria bacterium]
MLQNIREKFTGWIAISILALIGLSFVFVGLNYSFIGQSFAAKVDGIDIGVAQFENAYREQLQGNPQFAQLPPEYRQQLRSNILEQLIQQRVIDNYLDEAGYQISDQQVTAMIQSAPDFQVDGRFDMETYRTLLAQAGYEPARFEAAQRVQLRREQLQRAIRGSALVSPAQYRRFLNLAGEQRIVTLATIDADAVASEVSVTDEMIAAYYDDNPTLYQLPETADVEYVEIARADVAEAVAVTEQELQEYYEVNQDRYLQDEQRQARHILILFGDDEDAAEEKARALLARAEAGEPFEDLARTNSEDGGTAQQGGDLGVLTRTQLPGELGGSIFSMNEGTIEGPVKTDFGYHIIRLDRILEQGPLPLDQVRGELTTELKEQRAESLYRDLERKLSDALFDATDIRALASAVGTEVKTVTAYTRLGGEPFGTSQAAVDAIFDESVLAGGLLSEIVELDANRSAVFAVTNHVTATRQPLDEVRDLVAEALKAEQAETLMQDKADQMLEAVAAGEDFAAAAERIGASVAEPAVLTREAEDLDQFIAVAVFTALKPTQGEPTTGSTRNEQGGFTVFKLDAAIPGRPEAIPVAERDAGKLQLADQSGIGDFIAFVQALRADADVVVNDDVLAAQDLFQ